jgi:tagatose-6-phosphate ketose/aldose isomerase
METLPTPMVDPFEPLRRAAAAEQEARGYGHTLREILQQPDTWEETAAALLPRLPELHRLLDDTAGPILLTGSGSSLFVGASLVLGLHRRSPRCVEAIAAGDILTHARETLAPEGLLVSFARSGDSPESSAALDLVLDRRPDWRHIVFTCNPEGRLATRYRGDRRVTAVVLEARTNDRSLVMTSSFTNLLLAGRALAATAGPYRESATLTATLARNVIESDAAGLARLAQARFDSAVFLGSGARHGAAREAALKLLEMTAGRVKTIAESCLGLRHGPMSWLDARTLLVLFLSSDERIRAYEVDVVRELARKALGGPRVFVGEAVPRDLLRAGDVLVDTAAAVRAHDEALVAVDVLVAQLLAFFHCRHLGLRPDAPSPDGVIQRVVAGFPIH